MLLLNAGLGLVIPPHVGVLLAFRLRGGGGLGLSKGRSSEDGSDAQGNNGRDGFHGVFLHLLSSASKRRLWRRVPRRLAVEG